MARSYAAVFRKHFSCESLSLIDLRPADPHSNTMLAQPWISFTAHIPVNLKSGLDFRRHPFRLQSNQHSLMQFAFMLSPNGNDNPATAKKN